MGREARLRATKKRRNGKGSTKVDTASADDLQLLLDAANKQQVPDPLATLHDGEAVQAVAIRCFHSRGTPGLVMNFETYITHRQNCPIEKVSTRITEIAPETRRVVLPVVHRHVCPDCHRLLKCDPLTCLLQPAQAVTCETWTGESCVVPQPLILLTDN